MVNDHKTEPSILLNINFFLSIVKFKKKTIRRHKSLNRLLVLQKINGIVFKRRSKENSGVLLDKLWSVYDANCWCRRFKGQLDKL